jgi:hypothetical protein
MKVTRRDFSLQAPVSWQLPRRDCSRPPWRRESGKIEAAS